MNVGDLFVELQTKQNSKMKKIGILVASALVMGLSFTSCSSDDDNSNNIGSIVGKWNFDSAKYTVDGVSESEPYDDHEPGCAKDYLEFLDNGSAIAGDYVEGCVLIPDAATYTRSGNVLTIDDEGSIDTSEILVANATTLVLRYVDTYEDGTIETTDVTLIRA